MPVYRTTVEIASPSLGGTGTNTWHIRTYEPTTDQGAQLDIQLEAIHTFYDSINDRFAVDTVISSDGVCTQVDDSSGTVFDRDGWSVATTGESDPLPPADCIVVGWRADNGGRSGRGRTFLGPLGVNTLQSNGTPEEDTRSSILTAAQALVSESTGELDGAVCIWSPKDNVGRDITAASVRNVFAVLRSRRD